MSQKSQTLQFLSPFSIAYWRSAVSEGEKVRMLTLTALFVAIRVVVGLVPIPLGDNPAYFLRFSSMRWAARSMDPVLRAVSGFAPICLAL